MSTADPSAEHLLEVAGDAAREAGRLIMARLPLGKWRGDGVEEKGGRELVSEVDRASEQLLVRAVRESFPDHAIIAEEGGEHLGSTDVAPYRWLIDPLDGTANFVHGHPYFAVSMGVERLEADGSRPGVPRIVAGVVYLPYLDEMYVAIRGEGAFLNSRTIRLSVSPTDQLADALVATGFAYDRDRYPNYDNFLRLARQARGIRRCGAAAIDLAFVAAGRYDAFWELGLRPHDMAAGSLLVREAGGRISDLDGGDHWLDGPSLLATNGLLHEPVRELLEGPPERRG